MVKNATHFATIAWVLPAIEIKLYPLIKLLVIFVTSLELSFSELMTKLNIFTLTANNLMTKSFWMDLLNTLTVLEIPPRQWPSQTATRCRSNDYGLRSICLAHFKPSNTGFTWWKVIFTLCLSKFRSYIIVIGRWKHAFGLIAYTNQTK